MTRLISDISMSLDGCVAGPTPSLEQPLGEQGERLHEWAFGLKSWREPHGLPGGERGPDDALVAESLRATGAVVMGPAHVQRRRRAVERRPERGRLVGRRA